MQKHAIILHSGSLDATRPDEADTLVQVQELSALLHSLGWRVTPLSYDQNEATVGASLRHAAPHVVVNLVEAALGSDAQSYRATQLLDQLGIAYTGAPTHCLRRNANKPRVKTLLASAGIPTPVWAVYSAEHRSSLPAGQYIIKSETEHGSLGLDSDSVVDAAKVWHSMEHGAKRYGGAWFAEQYIDGREFNLSLLANGADVAVLPVAEITFDGLPATLPKIVDYAAKWDEASLTSRHSRRVFPTGEAMLHQQLTDIARRCWDVCSLKGYARVDFRVATDGTPYVIDINPNPCLSADAGFMASAAQAGLSPVHIMQRILDDACDPARLQQRPAAFVG